VHSAPEEGNSWRLPSHPEGGRAANPSIRLRFEMTQPAMADDPMAEIGPPQAATIVLHLEASWLHLLGSTHHLAYAGPQPCAAFEAIAGQRQGESSPQSKQWKSWLGAQAGSPYKRFPAFARQAFLDSMQSAGLPA